MEPFLASLVAQMHACNARIEAMKAENAHYAMINQSPIHGLDSFHNEALELGTIAAAMRSQCP